MRLAVVGDRTTVIFLLPCVVSGEILRPLLRRRFVLGLFASDRGKRVWLERVRFRF